MWKRMMWDESPHQVCCAHWIIIIRGWREKEEDDHFWSPRCADAACCRWATAYCPLMASLLKMEPWRRPTSCWEMLPSATRSRWKSSLTWQVRACKFLFTAGDHPRQEWSSSLLFWCIWWRLLLPFVIRLELQFRFCIFTQFLVLDSVPLSKVCPSSPKILGALKFWS